MGFSDHAEDDDLVARSLSASAARSASAALETWLPFGTRIVAASVVTGAPSSPGVWCGDYSEVVGPHDGIAVYEGKRMLRFLRGDFAGKPVDQGHRNVQRLFELRPYRQLIAKGNAVMRMSARFKGQPSVINPGERCIVAGHALGAEVADKGTLHRSTHLLKRGS